MTDTRGAIRRGTLRVDARKAVLKLREHLLSDAHLYLCELVRAAVAAGATEIELEHDADDVNIRWNAAPPSAERMVRLLDHLLSAGPVEGERPLYLLALAVNAALGLPPRRIELVGSQHARVWRVCFTPELARDSEPKAPKLVSDGAAPNAPASVGFRLRKRVGVDVVRRALGGPSHRELSLLSAATRHLDVRLSGVEAATSPPVLASMVVEGIHGARRALLELLPAGERARLDMLELGVHLETLPFEPAPHGGRLGREVPVRLVVDAHELPTNASRSRVRDDAAIVDDARARGSAACERLLGELALHVVAGHEPRLLRLHTQDRDSLEDALGAMVLAIASSTELGVGLHDQLAAALELPLLRDGAGLPAPLTRYVNLRAIPVVSGSEAVDPELAPWLTGVLRLRGRYLERALATRGMVDASALVERARLGAERRRRALEHPPQEPRLPEADGSWLRAPLRPAEGCFEGIVGEVALRLDDTPARALLTVEERVLEQIELESIMPGVKLDAAIGWPGRLRATFDYDAVERDRSLCQAIGYAYCEAVALVAALGQTLERDPDPRPRRSVAALLLARGSVSEALGLSLGEDCDELFAPLLALAIWPLAGGRRSASTNELVAYARTRRALAWVEPGDANLGVAPDGRPVLVATARERRRLGTLLGAGVEFIPYARALARNDHAEARFAPIRAALERERHESFDRETWPVLRFELPSARGFVAPHPSSRLIALHAGVELGATPRAPGLGDVLIALEDDRVVPDPTWTRVSWRPAPYLLPAEIELVTGIIDSLLGETPRANLERAPRTPESVSPALRAYLLRAIAALGACAQEKSRQAALARDAHHRAQGVRLVPLCDATGAIELVTLAELRAIHPIEVPVLDAAPGFATADWRPVVLSTPAEQRALTELFPGAALASAELGTRRERAEALRVIERLKRGPRVDVDTPPPGADEQGPHARKAGVAQGTRVVVSLRLPSAATPEAARVVVQIEGHELCLLEGPELPGNVLGRAELSDERLVAANGGLRVEGYPFLRKVIEAASLTLVSQGLKRDPAGWSADRRLTALAAALLAADGAHTLAVELQAPTLAWPTAQGVPSALPALVRASGQLWTSRVRWHSWRAGSVRSDLDEPVLLLLDSPVGAALGRLLAALGFVLRDVTDALDTLQRARGGSLPLAPARLLGEAIDPRLRRTLAQLGEEQAEGEAELATGDSPSLTVLTLDGGSARFPIQGPLPLSIVARVESTDVGDAFRRELTRRVTRSLLDHLVRLVRQEADPPERARAALRELVSQRAGRQGIGKKLNGLPLFPDIDGGWHSLEALLDGKWRWTELEPPYPTRQRRRPVLRLTESEAEALKGAVELARATRQLLREREDDERRQQPPLEDIRLSTAQRADCMIVVPASDQQQSGEIGIIRPALADGRGSSIALSVDRRPLCQLTPELPWPLLAAVDDPRVRPDSSFRRPASRPHADRAVRDVWSAAELALRAALAPEGPTLAAEFGLARLTGLRIAGWLWLPAPGGDASLVVDTSSKAELHAASRSVVHAAIDARIPIAGHLLVAGDVTTHAAALDDFLLHACQNLTEAARPHAPPEVVERMDWTLALLGAPTPDLHAVDALGHSLPASAVIEEVQRHGCVWVACAHSSADGEFPLALASFVLPRTGSLVEVLRERAPGLLRELGADPVGLSHAEAPPPARRGWLSRLFGRSGEDERASRPSDDERAGLDALRVALGGVGSSAVKLGLESSNEAIAYDRRTRCVTFGASVEVRALLARAARDRGALSLLVAAVMAEKNAALEHVTDADERRVLADLLAGVAGPMA